MNKTRLIDADAFKELLGTDTKIRETFCKVIDAQPTAYDVENVVEDLQKVSTIIEQNENSIKCAIEENMAVYIVKRGGVK